MARPRLFRPAAERCGKRLGPLLDAKEDASLRILSHVQALDFSRSERLLLSVLKAAGRVFWWARVTARFAGSGPPWGVRRILVVRQSWLGDLIVYLPTLAALRARFPAAHVTLGVQHGFSAGALLEGSGLVDEVREITFPEGGRARLAGLVRLFLSGADVMVLGAWYFMLRPAFFAGAPIVVGLADGHPVGDLLDIRVPLQPFLHEAENSLAIAEALGARPTPAERVPRLAPPDDPSRCQALLARLNLPFAAPLVALHAGSKRWSRRWSPERFAKLATRLLQERATLHVVLSGTAEEHGLAESIRALVPTPERTRLVNAAGACNLLELRLLFARCEALICNDTGVMHLARAQGTPLVALLGPENDRRWGPHPLGAAPAISLRHEVPCAPCNRHLCESHWCLRLLPVEQVHAAVHDLRDAASRQESAAARYVPLVRRSRHYEWTDLVASGFELPLITVVIVCPYAFSAGADTRAAEESSAPAAAEVDPWLAPVLDAVAAQRYPRIEVVVIEWDDTPARLETFKSPPTLQRVVALRGSTASRNPWQALQQAALGEFVCAATIDEVVRWDVEKLGNDVAALVRTPEAGLTKSILPVGKPDSVGSPARAAGWAVRRAALAAALAAPGAQEMAEASAAALRGARDADSSVAALDDALCALLTAFPATASDGFLVQPLSPVDLTPALPVVAAVSGASRALLSDEPAALAAPAADLAAAGAGDASTAPQLGPAPLTAGASSPPAAPA